MMSISPEAGQSPYAKSVGSIQIAGQVPLPEGSFARASTLQYSHSPMLRVSMRADE